MHGTAQERWVNPALAPDSAQQDFTRQTPNQYLMSAAPLQRVEYRIEAAVPADKTRHALAMKTGEACLILHRRTWSHDRVASVANLWYPGDRYQLTGHF